MIKIKNWKKFQHFSTRKPPWVKLYRDLLDDMAWHDLDPAASKALIMFWLIASENDGVLPNEKTLAFRLRTTEAKINSYLSMLYDWLDHDDINVISDRYQDDPLEKERETEKEREAHAKKISGLKELEDHPLDGHHKAWFEKNCPLVCRFELREELVRYCRSKGKSYSDYWATLQTWGSRKQKQSKPFAPKVGKTLDDMKKLMGVENV